MDAVDIALVDFSCRPPRLTASSSTAWPQPLRERLRAVAEDNPIDATAFAILDAELGYFLAAAINQLLQAHAVDSARVTAIGCHGQTVAHTPDTDPPTTLQLGDANVIAERTGITTVNDFRRRDMAAGGQGAPLAPAFHQAFLRSNEEDRAVLNLGGIANITILPSDPERPVFGFDTGPANCLLDAWSRQQLGKAYDDGGAWAASAQPESRLLTQLLDDPFFDRQPPKSTGTQHFSTRWLAQKLSTVGELPAEKVQATLMTLTTHTVADAIRRHAPDARRVLVCGGGAHNIALLNQLTDKLGLPVESTTACGIDPDWMEAMAFAWLAHRTLGGRPGNLPAVTGAVGPRILGAVHPA
jgi:anhydro-N-acetylmuramic acid kinase